MVLPILPHLLAAGVHARRAHFHAEVLPRGEVLKLVHFAVLQVLAVVLAVLQQRFFVLFHLVGKAVQSESK